MTPWGCVKMMSLRMTATLALTKNVDAGADDYVDVDNDDVDASSTVSTALHAHGTLPLLSCALWCVGS